MDTSELTATGEDGAADMPVDKAAGEADKEEIGAFLRWGWASYKNVEDLDLPALVSAALVECGDIFAALTVIVDPRPHDDELLERLLADI